ncbi:MAG: hypothetical protein ACQKBV_05160, partial [Puniceicoccales bacterium]
MTESFEFRDPWLLWFLLLLPLLLFLKGRTIGSNSFSGAHFVDYCLEQGMEVAGVSRSEEPD